MSAKAIIFWLLHVLGVNWYFRRLNRGRVKVLLFHSISEPGKSFAHAVSPAQFDEQLRYLVRHFAVLRMTQTGELKGYDPNKVNVLITFDDGFVDNYRVAAPLLERYGILGTFFLIASCVPHGDPPAFVIERSKAAVTVEDFRTVTWTQARSLIERGHCVASHSLKHSDYALLDDSEVASDARRAKSTLQALLGQEVSAFAFPWGRHRAEHLEQLQTIYRCVFTTVHGFNAITDKIFCRSEVANLAQMRSSASGSLDFFKQLPRRVVNCLVLAIRIGSKTI